MRYAETAAAAYAVELIAAPVHNDTEIEGCLSTLAREPNGGLIVLPIDIYRASRADHRTCGPAPLARDLRHHRLRRRRRPDAYAND